MQSIQIKNHEFLEGTKDLKNDIEKRFLLLGKRLKKIRDEQLYVPEYEKFYEWLEGEMKMSESTASRLITVYTVFIEKYEMDMEVVSQIGWSDAYALSKSVKTKEEAEEWLEKGALLTSSDLRKELVEFRRGKPCDHTWEKIPYEQCTGCGERRRIL